MRENCPTENNCNTATQCNGIDDGGIGKNGLNVTKRKTLKLKNESGKN